MSNAQSIGQVPSKSLVCSLARQVEALLKCILILLCDFKVEARYVFCKGPEILTRDPVTRQLLFFSILGVDLPMMFTARLIRRQSSFIVVETQQTYLEAFTSRNRIRNRWTPHNKTLIFDAW